jgi:hypothetical protein
MVVDTSSYFYVAGSLFFMRRFLVPVVMLVGYQWEHNKAQISYIYIKRFYTCVLSKIKNRFYACMPLNIAYLALSVI